MTVRFRLSLIAIFSLLIAGSGVRAALNSPTSLEMSYTYEAEFRTALPGNVAELIQTHAKFLYGYLQSESQAHAFGLNERIEGVGSPLWPPTKMTVLSEKNPEDNASAVRLIRYRAEGVLILHKKVAQTLLRKGIWSITLPSDMDHFFDPQCAPWDSKAAEDFWYAYDPFKPGCERLTQAPLANRVELTLTPLPKAPQLMSELGKLRGSGKKIFQIASVDGFYSDLMGPKDFGRLSFAAINQWLIARGFHETVITERHDLEIRRFDKIIQTKEGKKIPVQVLRFLGEVELKEPNSGDYARFLIAAIRDADVILYDGHSGYGLNMKVEALQARAGEPVVFDQSKRQVFFFNSCSSYSYFLPVFLAAKAPGTLDFLSNGLQTMTDKGVPVAKAFYRYLLDANDENPSWNEIISNMEAPLEGGTFLLNVSRSAPESSSTPLPR